MTKKILIVFGTRPEIIKLAPLILTLRDSILKDELVVVSTSQHDELLDEQQKYWGVVPDYFLTSYPQKGNLTRLLSHTLNGLQDILEQLDSIEYIVVQGDTNTALACAHLAFLNKIKLVHIEAGLRSFDYNNPFPEEFNRTIATKVAYFHFAPTQISRVNLLNEGIDDSKIKVIGNTVIDALYFARKRIENRASKKTRNLVLITLHRRENIEKNYLKLIDVVSELAASYPVLKFVWIAHPNCSIKIRSKIANSEQMKVVDQMPYFDFISLYESAKMVITDSGGVSEETIHLGLPIVIFRKTTERVEALTSGYPMLVSLNKLEIISFFVEHINKQNDILFSYGEGNSSQEIVKWLTKELHNTDYDIVIIGGGPAGTGLLLKAIKDGKNSNFFNQRIALIEKSSSLVKGNIVNYNVNSDTFSDVFLECLEGSTNEYIDISKLEEEVSLIRQFKGQSIPLKLLEKFYDKFGRLLMESLASSGKCDFFMNSMVSKVSKRGDNASNLFFSNDRKPISTKKIIIATGGIPINCNGADAVFDNKVNLNGFLDKCIHSDAILKSGIPEDLYSSLLLQPKLVILGGSHSAFSVAHFLLSASDEIKFGKSDIKIWSRSVPKIYFNSSEEALTLGYSDFSDQDICPITKKVYRLAGLRMDGRALYLNMLGFGNNKKEERISFFQFKKDDLDLRKDLEEATLIILAYGYRLNIFPILNERGQQIKLKGDSTGHWVNDQCELLDDTGAPVSNIFASGLATGFIPSGELGGEPSFEKQTNGIWYYQNAIAERIIKNLESENTSSLS